MEHVSIDKDRFPLSLEEIDKLIDTIEDSEVWKEFSEKGEARLVANNNMRLRAQIAKKNGIKDYIIENLKKVRNPSAGGKCGGKIQTRKTHICPYCGISAKSNGAKTWHFENCLENPNMNQETREKLKKWRDENKQTLSEAGKRGISKMKPEDRSKGAKKVGQRNVESGHLESLRTVEHQRKAGIAANSKKVVCPDGHVTSKPTATFYCKKRGLDPLKCVEISQDEYITLRKKI